MKDWILIKWIRRHIIHDIWRRLIALTLAVITWTGLRIRLTTQHIIQGSVKIEYDSSKFYIPESNHERGVKFTVNSVNKDASSNEVTDVSNYNLSVTLAPGKRLAGEETFSLLDIHAKKLPDGVSLVKMEPDTITVAYDAIVSKRVRLKEPPEIPIGIRKLKVSAMSNRDIELRGPSKYIQDITDLSLEMVPVNKDNPPAQLFLKVLNPYPTLGKQLTFSPEQVMVNLTQEDIVQDIEKTIQCQLRLLGNTSMLQLDKIELPAVTVTVRGKHELMEKLNSKTVVAFINLDSLTDKGVQECPIHVGGVPASLHYDVFPDHFTLDIVDPSAALQDAPRPLDNNDSAVAPQKEEANQENNQ